MVVFIEMGDIFVNLEVLHLTGPSDLRSGFRAQPGVSPPKTPKTPSFNETTTGFKFLSKKTHETALITPSFTETVNIKKGRFPLKPLWVS